MNKVKLLFSVFSLVVLMASCAKDNCTRNMTYVKYTPIYKTLDEIRETPTFESARELKNPGKIYLYGSLILINERYEGIHIVDNSNPSAPNRMGFISIPGNIDMAVSGNLLYADNYIDLLTLDISNIQNIQLLDREENAFPLMNQSMDPDQGLLVAYHTEEVTEDVDCSNPNPGIIPWELQTFDNAAVQMTGPGAGAAAAAMGGNGREASGKGGSMARFTISNQTLYAVDNSTLRVFDLSNPTAPAPGNNIQVGWGIETIFPYDNNLFIGSRTGMFIYSNANPMNPTFLSEFTHAQACDPVYVEGTHAYVTLRGGTPCQNFNNQLDIIDISNLTAPTLVSTTQMHNPHGLSVENDKLYLCDGSDGLKVFDVTDKQSITELIHEPSITTYDAINIPNANIVLVIGEDGFYQYDTSDPNALRLLSHIPVQ